MARKVEKLAVESWKPVDLSPSHAYVLLMVIEEPGVQPGNISNQLQLTPSTITRLIEKLEEKKLVTRTSEGKITNVYPTSKAKQLHPELVKCANHFGETYTSIFGKEESCSMVQSISNMADKLGV